jgi:hypothetical protein
MPDLNDPPASPAGDPDPAEGTTPEVDPVGAEGDTEMFPREVVEKLRRENASYCDRAKSAEARTDELARALFTARVAATGKVDPSAVTEVRFDADILDDPDAIAQAVDNAIAERPFIKARKVSGDAGQGERGEGAGATTFADLFR